MTQPMKQSTWYSVAAVFVSMLLLGVLGFFYTNHVARENDRKWCGLMTYLDEGYQTTPPTTASGKEFARRIRVLRNSLNCN